MNYDCRGTGATPVLPTGTVPVPAIVRPICDTRGGFYFMNALSFPLLFSIAATVLIVAIYFVWGRKPSNP